MTSVVTPNGTVGVQAVSGLAPVEAYAFAEFRFLFVQSNVAVFHTRVFARSSVPEHVHEDCDQFSFIVAGQALLELGQRVVEAEVGTCVRIPAGVRHSWRNTSEENLECLEFKVPAGEHRDMVRYVRQLFPDASDRDLGIDV